MLFPNKFLTQTGFRLQNHLRAFMQIFSTLIERCDSFSKWLEVEYMKFGTDSRRVQSKFISVFARFGLPDVIVTDGGPPFNSKDLVAFFEKHGIRVMKSPPYNPSSNGQAERMVRVVKDSFKKFLLDTELKGLDTEDLVSYFLFGYRNTCLEGRNCFVLSPKRYWIWYIQRIVLKIIAKGKKGAF